jgi:hypothetical protein
MRELTLAIDAEREREREMRPLITAGTPRLKE